MSIWYSCDKIAFILLSFPSSYVRIDWILLEKKQQEFTKTFILNASSLSHALRIWNEVTQKYNFWDISWLETKFLNFRIFVWDLRQTCEVLWAWYLNRSWYFPFPFLTLVRSLRDCALITLHIPYCMCPAQIEIFQTEMTLNDGERINLILLFYKCNQEFHETHWLVINCTIESLLSKFIRNTKLHV